MSKSAERKLNRQEKEFAAQVDTSATIARLARRALLIPDNVQGKTMVDVGTGASNLIADLLRNGADAYAVDQMYRIDRSSIEKMIERSLNRVLLQIPHQYVERMMATTNEAIQDFLRSYSQNPGRYKAGWFSQLPFPDNFSDFTTSMNAHSDLAGNYPLFRATQLDAIRITKAGRRYVMAPFHTSTGFHRTFAAEHKRFAQEILQTTNHSVEIVGPDEIYKDSRLVITK